MLAATSKGQGEVGHVESSANSFGRMTLLLRHTARSNRARVRRDAVAIFAAMRFLVDRIKGHLHNEIASEQLAIKGRTTMRSHMGLALGLSSLCLALVAAPANATVSSRASNYLFLCDGTNKTITLTFSGFTAGSTVNILGGELSLFENRGGVQYNIMRVQGDPTKQVVTLTLSDNRAQTMFPGVGFSPPSFPTATIPATIPATGNLIITVDGACNGGTGQTQGLATIWLYNNP
ncbi:MAG: hypothetical protein ACJ8FP_12335 [Xanthobacteraceae bacterium]